MGKSAQRKRNEAEIKRANREFDESRQKLKDFEFSNAFEGIEAATAGAGELGQASGYDAAQANVGQIGPAAQASAQGYQAQGYQSQGYNAAQAQAAQAAKTQLGEDTGRTNQFANLQVGTAAADLQARETDEALAASLESGAITGAGGATALAQAAARSKQGISADIQRQELANEQARAQGATDVQREALAQRNTARQANIQQDQFNTGLQQQTNLANQAATNQAAQFGAAAANQAAQFGAAAQNQAAQFGASAQNNLSQFNAQSQNQFAQAQFGAENQFALANQQAQNQAYQFGAAAQNQFAQAQFAADNAAAQSNADRINQFALAEAQGAAQTQQNQYNAIANLYSQDANAKAAANAAEQERRAAKTAAITGLVGDIAGAAATVATAGAGSDRRLKENIELVGQSESGLNIYEFNYKDDDLRFRGAMSDEVPEDAVIKNFIGPYDGVDYNKIDVDFELVWH